MDQIQSSSLSKADLLGKRKSDQLALYGMRHGSNQLERNYSQMNQIDHQQQNGREMSMNHQSQDQQRDIINTNNQPLDGSQSASDQSHIQKVRRGQSVSQRPKQVGRKQTEQTPSVSRPSMQRVQTPPQVYQEEQKSVIQSEYAQEQEQYSYQGPLHRNRNLHQVKQQQQKLPYFMVNEQKIPQNGVMMNPYIIQAPALYYPDQVKNCQRGVSGSTANNTFKMIPNQNFNFKPPQTQYDDYAHGGGNSSISSINQPMMRHPSHNEYDQLSPKVLLPQGPPIPMVYNQFQPAVYKLEDLSIRDSSVNQPNLGINIQDRFSSNLKMAINQMNHRQNSDFSSDPQFLQFMKKHKTDQENDKSDQKIEKIQPRKERTAKVIKFQDRVIDEIKDEQKIVGRNQTMKNQKIARRLEERKNFVNNIRLESNKKSKDRKIIKRIQSEEEFKIERKQSPNSIKNNKHILLLDKFKIKHKIAQGSFGQIYIGNDINNQKPIICKINKMANMNELEYEILMKLNNKGYSNFPQVYGKGIYDDMSFHIQERLGKTLERYQQERGKAFSFQTVNLIGIRLTDLLMNIHSIGYVYNDLKTDNILVGNYRCSDSLHQLKLIDFGLATSYLKTEAGTGKKVHIEQGKKYFQGNLAFSSFNAFNNNVLSRKDDMISLVYLLVYLSTGKLPFVRQSIPLKQQFKKIKEKKNTQTPEEFCSSQKSQFLIKVAKYIYSLEFDEEPNYQFIKHQFIMNLLDQGYTPNKEFDWNQRIISKKEESIEKIKNNRIDQLGIDLEFLHKLRSKKNQENQHANSISSLSFDDFWEVDEYQQDPTGQNVHLGFQSQVSVDLPRQIGNKSMERMMMEINEEENEHQLDKRSTNSNNKKPMCLDQIISHEDQLLFPSAVDYKIKRRFKGKPSPNVPQLQESRPNESFNARIQEISAQAVLPKRETYLHELLTPYCWQHHDNFKAMHKIVLKEQSSLINARGDKVNKRKKIRKWYSRKGMGISQSMNQLEELKDQVESLCGDIHKINDSQRDPRKIFYNDELQQIPKGNDKKQSSEFKAPIERKPPRQRNSLSGNIRHQNGSNLNSSSQSEIPSDGKFIFYKDGTVRGSEVNRLFSRQVRLSNNQVIMNLQIQSQNSAFKLGYQKSNNSSSFFISDYASDSYLNSGSLQFGKKIRPRGTSKFEQDKSHFGGLVKKSFSGPLKFKLAKRHYSNGSCLSQLSGRGSSANSFQNKILSKQNLAKLKLEVKQRDKIQKKISQNILDLDERIEQNLKQYSNLIRMGNNLKDQFKKYAKEAKADERIPEDFDLLSREIESEALIKAIESQKYSNSQMKKKLKQIENSGSLKKSKDNQSEEDKDSNDSLPINRRPDKAFNEQNNPSNTSNQSNTNQIRNVFQIPQIQALNNDYLDKFAQLQQPQQNVEEPRSYLQLNLPIIYQTNLSANMGTISSMVGPQSLIQQSTLQQSQNRENNSNQSSLNNIHRSASLNSASQRYVSRNSDIPFGEGQRFQVNNQQFNSYQIQNQQAFQPIVLNGQGFVNIDQVSLGQSFNVAPIQPSASMEYQIPNAPLGIIQVPGANHEMLNGNLNNQNQPNYYQNFSLMSPQNQIQNNDNLEPQSKNSDLSLAQMKRLVQISSFRQESQKESHKNQKSYEDDESSVNVSRQHIESHDYE